MAGIDHLSDQHLESFRRCGLLVLRDALDGAQTADVKRWVSELQALPEVPGKYMIYREDSVAGAPRRMLDRIENFVPYHDALHQFLTAGCIMGLVSELMGEPAVLFKEKVNFKLPDGRGFAPHQDMQAGWQAYADYFLTVAIPADPATEANGCLELAARAHDCGLLGPLWAPLDSDVVAALTFDPVVLEPGDLVFFDSFVPHRSAPNCSTQPRRTLYVTYNRLSDGDHRERYFREKRASFPPDCEREPGKTYSYKV